MKTRVLHLFLVAIISALFGYYIGVSKVSYDWKNYKPVLKVENRQPPSSKTNLDFALFWIVWDKIETSYYDKKALDGQKLLNGAITGMVQSLGDPYTVYLPPKQNTDFKQGMAGQFEGIGAELGMEENRIIVIAPLDGMPAQKAGVKSGDAILKVNNEATDGWTLVQTVEKIRGPKGTEVALDILHKDATKPTSIKITRGTITVKSVVGEVSKIADIKGVVIDEKKAEGKTEEQKKAEVPLLGSKDKQVAYIRLSQFGDNTNKEWISLINGIDIEIRKSDGKIKGVVLDMRNNPGGYLTDAAFIASEFISEGTVVIQEKGPGERTVFSVNRKGLLTNVPIVVLINKGSASASEIVAGALRDHKRAKLVGETSFGKGTIQQAEDLGSGAGIHITIAKWLTPNEIWVHGKGLTPDIIVKPDEKDPKRDAQLEKAIEELVK